MSGEHFPVVIHHNPDCRTSRNVVEIVRVAGYEAIIIEHLKTGWTRPRLLALFAAASLTARAAAFSWLRCSPSTFAIDA